MSTNGSLETSQASGLGSKFGTLVPNRIFVGGISSNTSEAELHSLFSKYGNVKATKIIMDKTGVSKGYGFVTFETEEEAQRIQKEVDSIVLKDRKLNIAPAIKKQPFSRVLGDPAQMMSNSAILYPSAVPQSYNNAALLSGSDNVYLPQAPYPVVYPQQVFMPQQYYQASSGAPYPQHYVYAVPASSAEMYGYGSGVAHSTANSTEYAESSTEEPSSEGGKAAYSKQNVVQTTMPSEYDSRTSAKPGRISSATSYRANNNSSGNSISSASSLGSPHFHPLQSHYLHHPFITKNASGLTLLTYPGSIVMGAPTILHVRDPSGGDHDMTELAFFPSALATGALTPPPTPLTPLTCDFGSTSSGESGGRKN